MGHKFQNFRGGGVRLAMAGGRWMGQEGSGADRKSRETPILSVSVIGLSIPRRDPIPRTCNTVLRLFRSTPER
jgi:hypothetical protein